MNNIYKICKNQFDPGYWDVVKIGSNKVITTEYGDVKAQERADWMAWHDNMHAQMRADHNHFGDKVSPKSDDWMTPEVLLKGVPVLIHGDDYANVPLEDLYAMIQAQPRIKRTPAEAHAFNKAEDARIEALIADLTEALAKKRGTVVSDRQVMTANIDEIEHMKGLGVGDDTRSVWMWIRLADGSLIFGCYPQGDTYEVITQRLGMF